MQGNIAPSQLVSQQVCIRWRPDDLIILTPSCSLAGLLISESHTEPYCTTASFWSQFN